MKRNSTLETKIVTKEETNLSLESDSEYCAINKNTEYDLKSNKFNKLITTGLAATISLGGVQVTSSMETHKNTFVFKRTIQDEKQTNVAFMNVPQITDEDLSDINKKRLTLFRKELKGDITSSEKREMEYYDWILSVVSYSKIPPEPRETKLVNKLKKELIKKLDSALKELEKDGLVASQK